MAMERTIELQLEYYDSQMSVFLSEEAQLRLCAQLQIKYVLAHPALHRLCGWSRLPDRGQPRY